MDYLWTFIAFGVLPLVMLLIGFLSMKRTKSSEDYFLGGRSLNGWVAALSAQASDMSGWLLDGTARRYLRVRHRSNLDCGRLVYRHNSKLGPHLLTVAQIHHPRGKFSHLTGIFENRFHDKSKLLRVASSLFIMVFFLVYTASAFSAGAKLFSSVFGLDYIWALAIGARLF